MPRPSLWPHTTRPRALTGLTALAVACGAAFTGHAAPFVPLQAAEQAQGAAPSSAVPRSETQAPAARSDDAPANRQDGATAPPDGEDEAGAPRAQNNDEAAPRSGAPGSGAPVPGCRVAPVEGPIVA